VCPVWAAGEPRRLSMQARALINSPGNELLFNAASLWEVATKRGLGREDFKVDARLLCRGLLDNGYSELPIMSDQVVAIAGFPLIHKDPFDRILVAQATVEGVTLLTNDFLGVAVPGSYQDGLESTLLSCGLKTCLHLKVATLQTELADSKDHETLKL
jgi:PIN domain nuclease of toxin-antitoxin system